MAQQAAKISFSRHGAVVTVLVALLSIASISAYPAIETDDLADGKIVNQNAANINQSRSSILDNIFNIPIQTLKAVNDLVQSIAGNLQQAGSGSYFRSRSSNLRNINVNVDDEKDDEAKKTKDHKN
ncbi:uncharacterized protein LOC128267825 [Anopheles cruzii]|uniref:uncharacterized protein LOC128267825 n=1 Tax=Anopheles cruzii TaxID=68878 RepID=UPI0022EC343E|nr:uncharacterized protein LOC128267825 [Anopheles cruzii]XP_052860722.1 uncharacterized protein LOC128267825 [Anopheles cruzii]